jgi:hypothetical protein
MGTFLESQEGLRYVSGTADLAKSGATVLPRPIPDVLKRASTWKGQWPAFLDLASETVKIACYYARAGYELV